MRKLLFKLRMEIIVDKLKIFWIEITFPFNVIVECTKRYFVVRKIYKETPDNSWERYVKLNELKRLDELNLRLAEFFSIKRMLVSSISTASMLSSLYQDDSNYEDLSLLQNHFENVKATIIELFKKLDKFQLKSLEGSNIKNEIISWELQELKTNDEVLEQLNRFLDYVENLTLLENY